MSAGPCTPPCSAGGPRCLRGAMQRASGQSLLLGKLTACARAPVRFWCCSPRSVLVWESISACLVSAHAVCGGL